MPDPPEPRVLAGRPTVRTPEGERVLDEGDIVAFPAGRSGAHCAYNYSKELMRYPMLSEDELAAWLRLEDQVDSWD
jgi:uncharacterized cupin superfamily protein